MHVCQCMLVQYVITQQPVVYIKNQTGKLLFFVCLFFFHIMSGTDDIKFVYIQNPARDLIPETCFGFFFSFFFCTKKLNVSFARCKYVEHLSCIKKQSKNKLHCKT